MCHAQNKFVNSTLRDTAPHKLKTQKSESEFIQSNY